MDPLAAKKVLGSGLLSFPITDFGTDGSFDAAAYRARLEWLMPYGASALFAAGGTGEGFSLSLEEHRRVIHTAVETCGDHTPIIASAGYGTALAIEMAQAAERAGAAALLLLPHYLTEAPQQGVLEHVIAVCKSVSIGVIVYNRNVCRLTADSVARIAEACPNFIGFKDGLGDIELMVSVRRKVGDRLAYLGGLPTAEIFAEAYKAIGVPVYSSAVFNFIPRTAMDFYSALAAGDSVTTGRLLDEFFLPYIAIRNKQAGYAVSIVKAGARLVGRSAGPVRTPLADLTEAEDKALSSLIERLGPQ
jgi:5-dehydro-4-deoxyglucarate dehydratase